MKKLFIILGMVLILMVTLAATTQISGTRYKEVATGNIAIATTVAPSGAWRLDMVKIHLNGAGGAGNLTITMDAIAGGTYDTVLLTQDMTAVVDMVWLPDNELLFTAGDEIDIAWANAGGKIYGLEVYITRLN